MNPLSTDFGQTHINRAVIWVLMALLALLVMGGNCSEQMSAHTNSSPAHDSQNQSALVSEQEKVAAQSDQQASEPENTAVQPGKQHAEFTFYNQNGKWVRSWFQCDQTETIVFMLETVESRKYHYIAFQKHQPLRQTFLELSQKGSVDCGMMKCWWELKSTHEGSETYVVQESHYYNQEDGYWTKNHLIGTGSNREAAESHMQPCRWFPRTRMAILTDQRAIYVTETTSGSLEYRSYDYEQTSDQPSLTLTGGVHEADRDNEMESFTFKDRDYTYVVNISSQETHPKAQVFAKRNDAVVQEERCLSYTYLRKA